MHATRSRKHSKSWNPKLLIVIGSCALAWFIFSFTVPFLIRANRGVIRAEITRIQALPEAEQEGAYIRLLRATGNDQEVSRALADSYKAGGQYKRAGETYVAARPALRVEAAQAYIQGYDFSRAQEVLRDEKGRGADVQILKTQATLNIEQNTNICAEIRQNAANTQSQRAKDLNQACEIIQQKIIDQSGIYKLPTLGAPLQAKRLLESKTTKSSSDYLLLATISYRQGDYSSMQNSLRAGLEATPYDRGYLTSATDLLTATQGSDQELIAAIQKNLDILPSQ
ncbi:hypothetical protein IT415_01630 [bacterium]|nr:hypothetical protein [bacterium]